VTIQVQGHVESMGQGLKNMVRLTIYVQGDRTSERIVIDATKEELANQYLPGTSVQVTIRPL
jgi:hypothetical protein